MYIIKYLTIAILITIIFCGILKADDIVSEETTGFEKTYESSWFDQNEFKLEIEKLQRKSLISYKVKKGFAVTAFIAGLGVAGAGLGLAIKGEDFHDLPGFVTSWMMAGGLGLFGAGFAINSSSELSWNRYRHYLAVSKNDSPAMSLQDEYEKKIFIERSARKTSVKTTENHGIAMICSSVPIFAVSIYSIVSSAIYFSKEIEVSDEDCSHGCTSEAERRFFIVLAMMPAFVTLAPGIAILTIGITQIKKAHLWEREGHSIKPLITLDSVAPMIDPVSKTYGLSAGFSF